MIEEAFKAAVSWGIQPSEFWGMHPTEFWWLVDSKIPPKMYGSMTEHEMAGLHKELVERGVLHG